jgi:putative MATE family efflux protein
MTRTIDFTRGRIVGPLVRFAGPVLLAMFLQALYGAVDLLVVGHFASNADVSGVAIGSQLLATITNVIVSFAMGTTIFLGQKMGEGDSEAGGSIVGTSIIMFMLIGLTLTILLPLSSGSLAGLMNAPKESFLETKQYIMICGAGAIMIVAYNVLGAIFRGIGDSTTPLVTVAIAAVINIFGDLLLVYGCHMGSAGAALATVLSQTISVIISLFLISKRKLPFTFHRSNLRLKRSVAARIFCFGAPIALQDFLVSVSFLVILAIVNTLGVTASAGVGVAEKVCAFIMLVPSAFMQSMSSFVAQNKGAGKMDRALHGTKYAILISTVIGIIMFYLAFFHGSELCRIFSSDTVVIANAADYLKAYGIDCLLTCFLFCMIGFYNGTGHTTFVMLQGVISAFFVRIPVSYIMSRTIETLFSIGLGIPCSTILQISLCTVYFVTHKKYVMMQS